MISIAMKGLVVRSLGILCALVQMMYMESTAKYITVRY